MFIFSLHREGDKQCWPRQCHADTRKRSLGAGVVFLPVVTGWERRQGDWLVGVVVVLVGGGVPL